MTLSEQDSSLEKDQAAATQGWTPPALRGTVAVVEAPLVDLEHEAELARQRGYDAGFAQGKAAAQAQAEQPVAEMNALLASLVSAYADTDSSLLRDILNLTRRVSEAVLRRELMTDSDTLETVIGEALALLADAPVTIELSLHPADAQRTRELGLLDHDRVTVRESQRMQRGGLELRSGNTLLDASVEARLQAVLETLYSDAGLPAPTADSAAHASD